MRLFFILFFTASVSLFANEKVALQLKWLHQFQFAGYYAAKEKGFYSELGLDVEIRERNRVKNNIQQVISGEAEYGISDSVLLLYKAKKEPVTIVTPIFQHSPGVILTLKSSGIDSPYKLKNKKLMFYKKDTDGFGILSMLENISVTPILDRVKDKEDYTSLISKTTDAYAGYLTNEPFYFREKGVDINIINPANYGLDLYGDMLFTNLQEAKNHPQRVEKFKQATIKGWYYALEHKEEIIKIIKEKYAKNKSIEHLRYEANAIEEVIQHKSIPIGTLDKGRIKYTLQIYKRHGLIKNDIPTNDYIFEPFNENSVLNDTQKNKLFTDEESDYLKNKKVITMCIDPDWMPFEKNENGKHIGMSADYIDVLKDEINIPIRMINTKTWGESLEVAKARKCDIFSLVMPTKERREWLEFTKPYLSIPLVIVTNLDEFFISDISKVIDKNIGIVKGYAYGEILREKYPTMNFVEVQNVKDGLEQVKEGNIFGLIGTLATTGYHIQKDYIGQLKIAGKFDEKWELGIGVRNDEPILKDIFDKAIAQISPDKKQEILNKWISVNYDRNVNYKPILQWLAVIMLIFSSILFIILRINKKLKLEIRTRKETERKLQEISITDELTHLYNRRYFNKKFPQLINSAKREKKHVSFAILDIDYFKLYNDTYGHISGDEALQKIAESMQSSLSRADDYCFRLGGEEFGILFKGLDKEQSLELIEQVRQNIENLKIEHANNTASQYVTSSFGLVVKDSAITNEEELYREADDLLYKAKDGGRNRVCVND
ncbi:diguanylate cyclase (GGDEF domain), possibly sulfonate sensing [Sulfurimonas gotlandica GD1]|uniref:diguanylate cyclase n=1 Tax=Sulfurimonas gotlandica (strain DSM 19862 / JCM 16533 / GD1) TaxID=929558 RepID=B6BHU7_SULGG|nr:diguanylate cyclase [Sulfurimonas gotlandica]EDZ62841.1 diguanylate cyclase [Sulfurimonas gotlandica GD1]EHP30098.1 diguanylate cyclase (GGDEF domain), possibly sulfonate sensing [Sulfurimonas gotlandica GD1]